MPFIKDYIHIQKNFGAPTAIRQVVIPRIASHIGLKKDLYIPALLNWQRNFIKDIIVCYKDTPLINDIGSNNYKVWTCWWQGKDNMPNVIKTCHNSLLKNANGHEVILITKYNYRQFISLPNHILEKAESGVISFSHLSDIIRLSLLSKYGGAWIDAALFITKKLEFYINGIFMPKMSSKDKSINQGRWCFGVIYSPKNHKLIRFLLECLLKYWEIYNTYINYLMFDGFLRIAYEEFKDIRYEIDNLKISSPNLHESRYTFNQAADVEKFSTLVKNNTFLSLTWRIDYPVSLKNGKKTYYGLLLEKLNNDIK